ncbi:MAG: EVE domain-containing protein [Bacteroidetes bacterium]|nr:EVE domain-containing protein [Bacteroidota bacterium]MBP6314869.1 EVE domain-containing protein [Chitinophagaceae bacterium]
MQYWLVKSEPFKYAWAQFVKDKRAVWDGVRNYAARNNLRSMEKGDLVLFYHSNEGLEIVGIAEVVKSHYQDPSSENPAWLAVDLKPKKPLIKTVTLSQIKRTQKLAEMELLRISRLSVSVVKEAEFQIILQMADTKL